MPNCNENLNSIDVFRLILSECEIKYLYSFPLRYINYLGFSSKIKILKKLMHYINM